MVDWLNHIFGWVCGQNPEHTWAPGGLLLPCCERCTGLYVGAAVAVVLHWCCRPKLTGHFLAMHVLLFLAMVPCGLHWVPQTPGIRTASGVLYGFAVVALMRTALKPSTAGRPGEGWGYIAGLLMTLVALPVTAQQGGILTAQLLSAAVLLGAVAFTALSLAVLRACVRTRWRPTSVYATRAPE